MSGVGDATGPRRAVLAITLAAVMIGSVATAGVVLTQPASAAPETLSSCTTIDESGEYALTSDIDAGGETCFMITASDVTLDGNGHTITGDGGNDRTFGVFVNGTNSEVSNVTVTDLSTTQWFIGYQTRDASNVTITDTTAVDNKYYGYWSVLSEDVLIEDSVARDHTRGEGEGISVIRSTNLVLNNVTSVNNEYGVHIDNDARDIRIVDSTISNNSVWDYYMRGYSDGSQPANVTATNLTLGDAVVDIEASQNVVLGGTDSLPTAPESGQAVGAPLRTSSAGGSAPSALNLSVHYGDDAGVNESTLALEQYDQSSSQWSVAPPDVVDVDANMVTSPIEFTSDGTIHLSLVGEAAADGGEEPAPEPEPEPASFEVSNLDAPTNVTQGERAAVNVTVTNTGGVEATQTVEFQMDIDFDGDGTTETVTRNESVTLAPNASQTVTFAGPTDSYPVGTYTYQVSTANDSVTSEITIDAPEPEPEPVYYQVDFVAGEPLDELGGDAPLYAEQDRLLRFAHGNTDEGITQLGNAWASEDVREAVDYGHIGTNDNGTASVTFTVADGENVTLSLAVYEKPGPGFNASETQTLLDASTETFGPGEHTITVSLPGSDNSDGNATADLTAQSIRATPVA